MFPIWMFRPALRVNPAALPLPEALMGLLIRMSRTAFKASELFELQLTASLTKRSPLPDAVPLVLDSVIFAD